jgi:hypothetical protein
LLVRFDVVKGGCHASRVMKLEFGTNSAIVE